MEKSSCHLETLTMERFSEPGARVGRRIQEKVRRAVSVQQKKEKMNPN